MPSPVRGRHCPAARGVYYCRRCGQLFRDAPEVPFDVVADRWTTDLGALQAAGEIVMVRLPGGFYGVCLLPRESVWQVMQRSGTRRQPARDRALLVETARVSTHGIGITLSKS